MRVRVLSSLVGVTVLLAACQGNVFELSVGTCFDDPGSGEQVSEVPIVECTEPHDNEVYASFELDDGDYPGSEQIATLADEGCLDRFADWAGIVYEESRLVASFFAPTEDGWDELDDREIVCYVYDVDGEQLTGSVEGEGT